MNFILCLPVVNICFHWLSFHLKLINIIIFQSCSIKNQGLSTTKDQFQVISRPWNKTPEILGFSTVFKMHTNSVYTSNERNILATRVNCFALEYCHNIWRLRSGSSLNLQIHVQGNIISSFRGHNRQGRPKHINRKINRILTKCVWNYSLISLVTI